MTTLRPVRGPSGQARRRLPWLRPAPTLPAWGALGVLAALAALVVVPVQPARAAEPIVETQEIPQQGAQQAYVRLDMTTGDLQVHGGSRSPGALLTARFEFYPEHWRPEVTHRLFGSRADVRIGQPPLWRWPWTLEAHNAWNITLNDAVPIDLDVRLGAGSTQLYLGNANLSRLDVRMGAGEVTLDLRGPWRQDLSGYVHGGVGRLTVRLPGAPTGVRVDVSHGIGQVQAHGLRQEGGSYFNDSYGRAAVNIHLQVDASVGEIVLQGGGEAGAV